ncbi:hypothetical protein HK405_012240, partial [Cladochytrium tenue]
MPTLPSVAASTDAPPEADAAAAATSSTSIVAETHPRAPSLQASSPHSAPRASASAIDPVAAAGWSAASVPAAASAAAAGASPAGTPAAAGAAPATAGPRVAVLRRKSGSRPTAPPSAAAAARNPHFRFYAPELVSEGSLYMLPADGDERSRLRIQHVISKNVMGRLFHAPLHDLLSTPSTTRPAVLDVGCGPGFWTIDMANSYPHADIVGVGPLRVYAYKPENPDFAEEATEGPLPRFIIAMRHALAARGLDPFVGEKMVSILKDAGFADVKEKAGSITFGWNGPIGRLFSADFKHFMSGLKAFLHKAMGLTEDEYDKFCAAGLAQGEKDLLFMNGYVAWGRVQ